MSEKVLDPEIIEQHTVDDECQLVLKVPQSLHYFEGHFDQAQILPGVVQIDWAVKLGKRYFPIQGAFKRLEVIKFQQVIVPESRIHLDIKFDQSSGKLYFNYRLNGNAVSSGRVVFENTAFEDTVPGGAV